MVLQDALMDGVSDYLLSLPGGMLNPRYTIDEAIQFLFRNPRALLDKLFKDYTFDLVRAAAHYLVKRYFYNFIGAYRLTFLSCQTPHVNPLQAFYIHTKSAVR
jgi:hypothetical protein